MRILLLAPNFDAQTPGESWSTYKWVQGVSERCVAAVLTQHRADWNPAGSPVRAEVVNFTEPNLPGLNGRIAWELKPGYVPFYFRARSWIKAALRRGEKFDLIHQINPLALRYPCPARGLGIPYIVGPLAGSLATPEALRASTPEKQWYRKLRALDGLRLRHDPWLRNSYGGAAAIIGVAPYVEELLHASRPARFALMCETGVESLADGPKSPPANGEPLRLLFVGRLIRTKGILEAIEAVAQAAPRAKILFDILGTGDLAGECERKVKELNLGSVVTLHGRRPRNEVFQWYDRSHVFLFPSYREPSGNVVLEAMSRGLPVISSSVGGPGYVVTDSCGIRVAPGSREKMISDLADAIVDLAGNPTRLAACSAGALERMRETALWPNKIELLLRLYADVVGNQPPKPL
jgi:glycosyltransferase involved in cell wall biosynthesis